MVQVSFSLNCKKRKGKERNIGSMGCIVRGGLLCDLWKKEGNLSIGEEGGTHAHSFISGSIYSLSWSHVCTIKEVSIMNTKKNVQNFYVRT